MKKEGERIRQENFWAAVQRWIYEDIEWHGLYDTLYCQPYII